MNKNRLTAIYSFL